MTSSKMVSVLVCALLGGCSTSLEVGLANAPVPGFDTPETRVHDVIANGHDSCERSGFPAGGALRGQVPPCPTEKGVTVMSSFAPAAPPTTWVTPWHGLGVCSSGGPGLGRAEVGLTGISVSPRDLACEAPW